MWKTCVKHVFSCVKHVSLYVKTRVKITCLLVFYLFHFHVYTRYFYTCLQVQRHVFFTCFTRKISCWAQQEQYVSYTCKNCVKQVSKITCHHIRGNKVFITKIFSRVKMKVYFTFLHMFISLLKLLMGGPLPH